MTINQGYLSKLPVFFIVGRGRSGSTLLRTMLDAHPAIVIPDESRFVQYLYYQFGTLHKWTPELLQKALDYIEKGFEPLQINKECFLKLIAQETDELSFTSVCKAIYLSTSSEFNKEAIACIGDKNPKYSFFIPLLIRIFPEAKFIHLVRDYRDNALAVKRVHKIIGETGSLPVILARWKYYNSVIQKYKIRYAEKFYTLRFEDLIIDSERLLSDICNFLNLPYNPVMLNYFSRFNASIHGTSYSTLHDSLQHPVDKSKVGEWQTKLTFWQKMVCESLAGTFGSRYGYTLDKNHNKFLKIILVIIYTPVMFAGTTKYRLKALFYKVPFVMKTAYKLMLK